MSEFLPTEKADPIRFPSTANFYIDSLDRPNPSSTTSQNFTISATASLLNGYFTRMAVSEVMFDWTICNVQASLGNNTFTVDVSGGSTQTVTLPDGFYTVAAALDTLVPLLNTAYSSSSFQINNLAGTKYGTTGLVPTSGTTTATGTPLITQPLGPVTDTTPYLAYSSAFTIRTTALAQQLGLPNFAVSTPARALTAWPVISPSLLGVRYVDIVCNDLTYNQALKDSSTNNYRKDVLYRWNLGWSNEGGQPPLDKYYFPILQGYTPFRSLRQISFPKQIRWLPNQPVGNITLSLWMNGGTALPQLPANSLAYSAIIGGGSSGTVEYTIQLLVSEV